MALPEPHGSTTAKPEYLNIDETEGNDLKIAL